MKDSKNPAPSELFTDEEKARTFFEAKRWPDGPVCPHCGEVDNAYKLAGKTTRKGLYKCAGCREKFTVTMRSIFEDSHIPLHKWFYAIHLMCASKKGMSAHQFHRMSETFYGKKMSYRTAWFMFHRIRYAMTQHPLADKLCGIVEMDETYVGGRFRNRQPQAVKPGERPPDRLSPFSKKAAVFSILQRDGNVRSRHVERVTAENLKPVIDSIVAEDAHVMTDSSTVLAGALMGRKHDQVNHRAEEYVRRENGVCITTNGIEGFFATLKRGINGTYHHVGRPYLQQYLNEFDFRYNARRISDGERTALALAATEGKRMLLHKPVSMEGAPKIN